MNKKSYFDEIVNWKTDELSLVIHLAVKLIYSDGMADIQEWNVLHLLPALMEMLKSMESSEKAAEWQNKIDQLDTILEAKNHNITIEETELKTYFGNKNKQEAVIYFLLYIALADNVLHKKEIDFFKNHILKPFGWTHDNMTEFIKKESHQLPHSENLLKKVHLYFR
ncbi:MAG: hypothetical protein JXR70_14940 [Spirochaetales bacterium]|nr:hypothetical protein [Spirochaetales bacterium]